MKLKTILLSVLFSSTAIFASAINESSNPKPGDTKETWLSSVSSSKAGWVSTDASISSNRIPKNVSAAFSVKGWRGEKINAQAVLYTSKKMENTVLSVSKLRSANSTISSKNIKASFVTYVITDEYQNSKGAGGCGGRPDKSQFDSSLVADVISANKTMTVEAFSARPIWLGISIPQNAKPGLYKGELTIKSSSEASLKLPFEVEVTERCLPQAKDWKFHLDLWQNPYSVARYYGVELWSKAHFDKMRPTMKLLADAGQKVITATVMDKPWNGQTEDAFQSMIKKTLLTNGKWAYDYSVFDKWVNFMFSVGITQQINCYTMIPWNLRFDYIDEATNTVKYVNASPSETAYAEYWLSFLRDFSAHLKEKGWFSITTIAMDERPMESMKNAINIIHKADADFKISLAGNYYKNIESNIYDLCVAFRADIPKDIISKRRSEGKKSTIYTCCSEAFPNTFTCSTPAEASFLPICAVARGYDGYLRWAYNSWNKEPMVDTRFRSWTAGDCFMVYPGCSSIRFERFTEGVQYAEKLRIVRQELLEKGDKASLEKIDSALKLFLPENQKRGGEAEAVNALKALLN